MLLLILATTAYTDTAISNLVDSSPAALNTLNELAAALGDDANFSSTVNTSIAAKLPKTGGTMSGDIGSYVIIIESKWVVTKKYYYFKCIVIIMFRT